MVQRHAIPAERQRQFDLIDVASDATIRWAQANSKSLERIEAVVPFVESDFSLHAWLFVDTESRVREYQADGTTDELASKFRSELENAGYPPSWLQQTSCHFASREIVDRDFNGSYFSFLKSRRSRPSSEIAIYSTEAALFFLVGREKGDPGSDFSDKEVEAAKLLAKGLHAAPLSVLDAMKADGILQEIRNGQEAK